MNLVFSPEGLLSRLVEQGPTPPGQLGWDIKCLQVLHNPIFAMDFVSPSGVRIVWTSFRGRIPFLEVPSRMSPYSLRAFGRLSQLGFSF